MPQTLHSRLISDSVFPLRVRGRRSAFSRPPHAPAGPPRNGTDRQSCHSAQSVAHTAHRASARKNRTAHSVSVIETYSCVNDR